MRASCFRTSSIVSSRRAWRLMASRTSRRVSASTRRSRSASTVSSGSTRRRSRAISSRTASRASRGAPRRGRPAGSRPRGAAGRCSCLGVRAECSREVRPPCGRCAGVSRYNRGGARLTLVRERILFVCTANVDRSPTAEDLYAAIPATRCTRRAPRPSPRTPSPARCCVGGPGLRDVRAGGPPPHADQAALPGRGPARVDLDVEDRWRRGDPELVSRLLKA